MSPPKFCYATVSYFNRNENLKVLLLYNHLQRNGAQEVWSELISIHRLCSTGGRSTSALSLRSVATGPGMGSPSVAILSKTSGDNRSSFKTWVTRARETPKQRARSALETHSPLSKATCHSLACAIGLGQTLGALLSYLHVVA